MAASLTTLKTFTIWTHLFLYAYIENFALVADFANFFLKTLKDLTHVSWVRVFHVYELWWRCTKFPHASMVLITVRLGLVLLPVSWWLEEPSLVDSPGIIRLPILSRRTFSFLSLVRPLLNHRCSPDWPEIPNFVKRFPHAFLLAPHQTWSRFRHRRAFLRNLILASFSHGALLSNLIVRKKITEMATRINRENSYEQSKKMNSIHLLRNFLWLECQRIGSWC